MNNAQPMITASSLIGMIDTLILALQFSIKAKDNNIFNSIAEPILKMLKTQGIENNNTDLPSELLYEIYWRYIDTAWEFADGDDLEFILLPDSEAHLIPPRGTQPEYEEMCIIAIEDELKPAKALLKKHIATTKKIRLATKIMVKRLATYEEGNIGTIAELPNTIIDKICSLVQ